MGTTQVTLRNIRQSAALTREIEQKCASLGRFHPRILGCHVTLGREDHPSGPFSASVRVTVAGDEIVVNHAHHLDAHLALRDAFAAARRCLEKLAGARE